MLSCSNIFKAKEYIAPNISKKKIVALTQKSLIYLYPKKLQITLKNIYIIGKCPFTFTFWFLFLKIENKITYKLNTKKILEAYIENVMIFKKPIVKIEILEQIYYFKL